LFLDVGSRRLRCARQACSAWSRSSIVVNTALPQPPRALTVLRNRRRAVAPRVVSLALGLGVLALWLIAAAVAGGDRFH
jgi:hypothetical protein